MSDFKSMNDRRTRQLYVHSGRIISIISKSGWGLYEVTSPVNVKKMSSVNLEELTRQIPVHGCEANVRYACLPLPIGTSNLYTLFISRQTSCAAIMDDGNGLPFEYMIFNRAGLRVEYRAASIEYGWEGLPERFENNFFIQSPTRQIKSQPHLCVVHP